MPRQCQGDDGRVATLARVDRRVASAGAARDAIDRGVHVYSTRRETDRRGFASIARPRAAQRVARAASNSACVEKLLAFVPTRE
jgi:hypothetical protein